MKSLATLLICFVVAFFLGRWTPHYDLQQAQRQIKALKEKTAQREPGSGTPVTGMLGIGKVNERRRSGARNPGGTNAPPAQVANKRRPVSGEERLDQAIELWNVRTRLARASFIERMGAGEEEINDFDVLMAALNLRAEATISNWVARIEQQEQITSEDGIRMVSELLDWVVLTYDEMDRKLPANWREGVGDEFRLIEMIDPQVAAPLLRIEGRLGEVDF
ncbi:hypothetical protein [Pontiella sp.]|uniref:hypothetical protein n=1 Tax=Pontiella sp. TaxID=2837462 RepID=UPI00356A7201